MCTLLCNHESLCLVPVLLSRKLVVIILIKRICYGIAKQTVFRKLKAERLAIDGNTYAMRLKSNQPHGTHVLFSFWAASSWVGWDVMVVVGGVCVLMPVEIRVRSR